jgi:hypothetical protein
MVILSRFQIHLSDRSDDVGQSPGTNANRQVVTVQQFNEVQVVSIFSVLARA